MSAGALILTLGALGGCTALPQAPPYPYRDAATLRTEAQQISGRWDDSIAGWLRGGPAAIPDGEIPAGIVDDKHFVLRRPDAVTPQELWLRRDAAPVTFAAIHNGNPDPHATYLLLATPLAPYGDRIVVEGEFPHARYFSFQISPPFSGREYDVNRVFGPAEVLLVDADIDPLPGNVNPYRVGADRSASNRRYRVTFDLAAGDPVALNPSHKPPYRGPGNVRVGSLLVNQGPWNTVGPYGLHLAHGPWNMGFLWVRIYAPDQGTGPLGGVPLPAVWFERRDGTRYVVTSDTAQQKANVDATTPARTTAAKEPLPAYGPAVGWGKSYGILRSILTGAVQLNGWTSASNIQRIRDVDLGATGHGEFQPAPANYERTATENNSTAYFGRHMSLGRGKIAVLTGTMPTFPDTRGGNPRMEAAQVRYWSISTYDDDILAKLPGAALSSIMDDEVKLDSQRRYVIVFSRAQDRPSNATPERGVSWVNWGPTSEADFLLRWTSVRPEWSFARTPDEIGVPFAVGDFAGSRYDRTLFGINGASKQFGDMLPTIHYLSRGAFEALGQHPSAGAIPAWR